jgi:hypothetical protein
VLGVVCNRALKFLQISLSIEDGFNKPLRPLSGDVTLTAFGMTPLEMGPGFFGRHAEPAEAWRNTNS